jgi:hypothetical protein
MAWEIEHIKWKGFDKNPQNINRKGQPKKWIALVNSELAEAWYKPATKQDIEANYMAMLQLWQDKLTELANNKDKPMLVRIIAKNMLWGKGFDIIEKMLDRWIGKAVQKMEWDLNFKWDITVKTPE